MAHYAEILNGKVVQVHVVHNDVILVDGVEDESLGANFLADLYGKNPSDYVQASYNGTIRGYFPGVGFDYDAKNDLFIPPKPFDSWIWDADLFAWQAPIQKPVGDFFWNDIVGDWVATPGT